LFPPQLCETWIVTHARRSSFLQRFGECGIFYFECHCIFCSFLENLELVNTREVCRFLEVSRLSFSQEYGPKLHEGFVMVRHLANLDIEVEEEDEGMMGLCAFPLLI
jgi:hypothetical protein